MAPFKSRRNVIDTNMRQDTPEDNNALQLDGSSRKRKASKTVLDAVRVGKVDKTKSSSNAFIKAKANRSSARITSAAGEKCDTASSDACAAVFNTAELLEQILLCCSPIDIANCCMVSPRFRATINDSPELQRYLFLLPEDFSAPNAIKKHKSSNDASDTKIVRANPWVFEPLEVGDGNKTKLLMLQSQLRGYFERGNAKKRNHIGNMFLSQPPIKHIKIGRVSTVVRNGRSFYTQGWLLWESGGIKVKHLMQSIQRECMSNGWRGTDDFLRYIGDGDATVEVMEGYEVVSVHEGADKTKATKMGLGNTEWFITMRS